MMYHNLKCPECGGEEVGMGRFSGYASLQPEGKFLSVGSGVIAYLCINCGYIIKLQVEKPHIFKKKR